MIPPPPFLCTLALSVPVALGPLSVWTVIFYFCNYSSLSTTHILYLFFLFPYTLKGIFILTNIYIVNYCHFLYHVFCNSALRYTTASIFSSITSSFYEHSNHVYINRSTCCINLIASLVFLIINPLLFITFYPCFPRPADYFYGFYLHRNLPAAVSNYRLIFSHKHPSRSVCKSYLEIIFVLAPTR